MIATAARPGLSKPMEDSAVTDPAIIECGITSWFYRRRAMFAAMYLVAACLFFKDGIYSWPKENQIADKKEWFDSEVLAGYDKARAAGDLAGWKAAAKAKGLPLKEDGEPVKWAAYAAERGWPEKPKKRTPAEIEQQYYWGGAGALALFAVALNTLYYRKRRLVGHADRFITPSGTPVAFADTIRVDKRNWDVKGLAYVYYRPGGQGREKRAKIDDLMFDGAGRVLDRLLANFKGEPMEKVPDEEPTPPAPEPDSQA